MRRRHLSANKSTPYHKVHHRLFFSCFYAFSSLRCPSLAQDLFLVSVTRPAYYQLLSTSELKMCFQPVSRAADGSRSQTAISGIETVCNHLGRKKNGKGRGSGAEKGQMRQKRRSNPFRSLTFPGIPGRPPLTKSVRVRQKL